MQKTSVAAAPLALRFRNKRHLPLPLRCTALSQQKTSAGISTKPIPDALFISEKAKRKQQSCRGIIDCSIKQLNIELDEM
ncbi:hypothetical protein [Lysinibacillus xylanilyticus]|uniref:hypothetical protein n=1 Tax=Lysinibacillus xylanilyticus TaxID=582475 RepID=UPI0038101607